MLTTRGLGLLVGAALAVVVGRLLGVGEMLVVVAAAIVLVVLAVVTVHLAATRIAVGRAVSPPRLAFGEGCRATLELRNESRLPTALLLVEDSCPPALAATPRFVVPALAPGSSRVMRYDVRGGARGRHVLGPVTIRVQDPFGLAERARRTRSTSDLLVHPQVEALESGRSRGAHQGHGPSRNRRLLSAGDEFHSMREYVRGDDLRHVHWPSTARRQSLMVRQQEQTPQSRVTVLCDTRDVAHLGGGPSSTLEKAVSIAASILVSLARLGYGVRLVTDESDRPPRVAPVEVWLDQLAGLRAGSARAMAQSLERLHSESGQGLLVAVLAPPSGAEGPVAAGDLRALRTAGRSYRERLAVVVVDPGRRLSAARGRELAATLGASGWRAATANVGEPFAPVWQELLAVRRRAPAGRART